MTVKKKTLKPKQQK